jgi:hypothetical protein
VALHDPLKTTRWLRRSPHPPKDPLATLKAQRPESDRIPPILTYLALVPGAVAWRQNVGGAYFTNAAGKSQYVKFGETGLPDICGWVLVPEVPNVTGPCPLYLEVKREGGRRRPAQTAFVEMAKAAGCVAGFVTCVDEVRALLQANGVRCP